jgi:hypothetical protein
MGGTAWRWREDGDVRIDAVAGVSFVPPHGAVARDVRLAAPPRPPRQDRLQQLDGGVVDSDSGMVSSESPHSSARSRTV